MSKYAIEIENVSKRFYIGSLQSQHKTLKAQAQSLIARPLSRIASILGGKAPTHVEKELWALRNIDLKIKRGESVGIIGRNGSGKSTLLQLIANVMTPTEGQIITRGHIVAMLNIGTGFHPELTGRENLYINGTVLGLTPKELDQLYDDIVAFAEIEDFMDTPLKRYSSGMRVRLAFSVAIHVQPEIIILDEVLAVGDPMFREKCLQAIGERYQDTTLVIVSHNVHYLKRISERMIWLQAGQVFMDGPADEVQTAYMALVEEVQEKGKTGNGVSEANLKPPAFDNSIELIEAAMLNPWTKQPIGSINCDMGLYIRLKYKLASGREGLRVTCHFIHQKTDMIIYACSDADTEPRHQAVRPEGIYIAEFRTPKDLFTPGIYLITVVFDDPSNNTLLNSWTKVLRIHVIDNRSKRLEWIDEPKKGFINIDVDWEYPEWGNNELTISKEDTIAP